MKIPLRKAYKPQKIQLLISEQEECEILANFIRQKALDDRLLNILEAGCGSRWILDLKGVNYVLTGLDIDKTALENRKNLQRDIHEMIVGDLRTITLEEDKYHIIYSSYVLEHIRGAEQVLINFLHGLRPGGALILRIPNRDSVYGFLTRITPFWVHIFYKNYIRRDPNTGKPGYGPFITFHDKILSINGIHEFCKKHGLIIKGEYASNYYIRYFFLSNKSVHKNNIPNFFWASCL